MKNIILATIAISLSSLSAATAGNETLGYETRIVRQSTIHQNADANHPKGQAGTQVPDISSSRSYTSPIVLDRPTTAYPYHDRFEASAREDLTRTNSIRANADR